ncbi:MAG: hypothetical protein O2917_06265, partial [Acidobacteria bacterium]|nr:hypothetical protein [Acidobacteriota bacterium]
MQPGGDLGIPLEGVAFAIGVDKRILHGITRVFFVVQHPPGNGEQPTAVRPHQRLENRLVARLQALDQRRIIHGWKKGNTPPPTRVGPVTTPAVMAMVPAVPPVPVHAARLKVAAFVTVY